MKVSFLADEKQFIPTIAQWYFNEWGRLTPNRSLEDIVKKVTSMAESRAALPISFVLHDNDDLLAVAELKYHEHPDFPDYQHWLGGVFVPADKRGQGYSNIILSHTFKHAKNLGIPDLYLQCEKHNIDLYLKHDFEVIHRMNDKDVEKAVMVLRLG
ncbi:GNAT family N-acetyltransferase [Marinomonas sp.]|uniref:GNAT family N-acetyltransferase n=1 Tax=Marinomonas sp. TaxID=1904862 RepID=UPI003BAD37E6